MKRPWNLINLPVYSLLTHDQEGHLNMNVCTYVGAVSMQPKLYSIAIDYKTKTYQNLLHSQIAVLQLLSKQQLGLVRKLGKQSGFKVDKEAFLRKKDLLTTWRNLEILKDCSAALVLHKTNQLKIGGDHEMFYFKVQKFSSFSSDVMSYQDLIEKNIIL